MNSKVLHISNLFFLAFNLACAFAPNTNALIVFRFFGKEIISILEISNKVAHQGFIAGLGGSAPISTTAHI